MKHWLSTILFEVDPLGGGEGGGGEPPEPAAEEPPAPAAPEIDYGQLLSSPQASEAIGQAVYDVLGRMAEQAGGEEKDPELDLYGDPAEVQQNLSGLIQREIQQAIAPMLPAVEQMEIANWQDKIEASLGQLPTVKEIEQLYPENHPDDQGPSVVVERLATAFLPEMRNLYGDTDRALEASLRAAADYFLPIAKALHGSGYSGRSAELQRLSGAPAPAPAQGGPAELVEEPKDEFEALERYAARHDLR